MKVNMHFELEIKRDEETALATFTENVLNALKPLRHDHRFDSDISFSVKVQNPSQQ